MIFEILINCYILGKLMVELRSPLGNFFMQGLNFLKCVMVVSFLFQYFTNFGTINPSFHTHLLAETIRVINNMHEQQSPSGITELGTYLYIPTRGIVATRCWPRLLLLL